MGLINWLIGGGAQGVAKAVETTAGAFIPNAERDAQRQAERFISVQEASTAGYGGQGWFNGLVDALNRLPRPMMAFGVIALFANAMFDPVSFASRMVGLQAMPPEMWWLVGAVVSFYFGARELQKSRKAKPITQIVQEIKQIDALKVRDDKTPGVADDASPGASIAISSGEVTSGNAAIKDWKRGLK